jgi:hypothetical protein
VPEVPAYIGLEVAAASIRSYEALVVPALFQTPDYARSVIRSVRPDLDSEEVERRVELRMARQSLLYEEDPPTVMVVLDEAVLRRAVRGRRAMREQVHRLVEAAALPTVTLQVLPFGAGHHAGMDGAFTILSFTEPVESDLIVLDATTSDLYLESAEDLRRYQQVFNLLRAAALTPNDSTSMLVALRGEL